ncbi:hypothetical protein [Gordonia neofelifaecis]|uniref:Secreted protein n=1 Tax=Gordonia neofelifaecis NRRL B-59395 TaxID=644548 RepID=F1YJW4_9ACTN|nr:hypothetical protein [Gordonia neofelifaecis]EGD55046.1 hypothetical protein SCNU_10971 [Gordonia neofelifaecis NRRL B-59395]
MTLRTFRRFLIVAVATMGLVAGLTLVSPGQAAAATRYDGPTLKAEQGDFAGKNLRLTLTDPNVPTGVLGGSSCTSILMNGTEALQAFVAFNAQNYLELLRIIAASHSPLGPAASNSLLSPGTNSNTKTVTVPDGVYLYFGTCGGLNTALDPSNIGVTMRPVIVPDGVGSISPVIDFGSLAMQSGAGIADILAIFSLLGNGS